MLKMLKLLPGVRRVKAVRAGRPSRAAAAPATRADLQIRNLLDDPGLRRAMGLDLPPDALLGGHSDRNDAVEPMEPMEPALELVAAQPEALVDLREVVRHAAA